MRLIPSMKQAVIRRSVKKFADERLSPGAAEMDGPGIFPSDIVREMGPLHYFGLQIPPEYGGAGLDTVSYAIAVEEISRAWGAMGLCIAVHNSVAAYPVFAFGDDYQRCTFLVPLAKGEKIGTFCLTEPNAGSDATALETTARREGNEYVLNGNKVFVTNGGESGINLIFASSGMQGKKRAYSVFIVESGTEGVEKGPREELMGMRANPVCPIALHDCRIPAENLLGHEGQGMKIALATLAGGRIGIAAQALGIAQAALDVSLKYARERRQFGKTLGDFEAIRNILANMVSGIEAARLLVYRAAWMRDQGLEYVKESAMAKLYASGVAVDTTRAGVQIHGGYGYSKAYPIERFYRDAKVCEIYEGTSEIQRMVIARNILTS